MNALLLSHCPKLQAALQQLLQSIRPNAALWQCEDVLPARAMMRCQPAMDLVVIDLGWCGVKQLEAVTAALRPQLDQSVLMLLADQPGEALAARGTGVVADLTILCSEPGNAVKLALQRALERRRQPVRHEEPLLRGRPYPVPASAAPWRALAA